MLHRLREIICVFVREQVHLLLNSAQLKHTTIQYVVVDLCHLCSLELCGLQIMASGLTD